MNESIKGIFFDVDDTLYDHLAPFRTAVDAEASVPRGFPYEEAYHRMRYYSDMLSLEMGGAGAMEEGQATERMRTERFRLSLAEFGVKLTNEEAARMQAAYIGCQYQITMFEGARELIGELAARGFTIGLITNGAPGHQMMKIKAMQLDDLIPPERQFVSGATGWDKPDQRLFHYVNERTGTLPSNSIYIGDSWRNDVTGALSAGWSVIWFNHRGVKPESDQVPDSYLTADNYTQLRELLLGLKLN
ncbi:HAD family hydrolase [Paenibacillus sp. NPDC058071]|uniref:HAD family hydrolase n=1 Tax=Paenibacillus sp. NPDC058071 TaxID=3346326 RepID=UPI0036D803FE